MAKMDGTAKNKSISMRVWHASVIGSVLTVLVGCFWFMTLSDYDDLLVSGVAAGILTLVSIFASVVSIICVFNTRGWWRVICIMAVLLCLIVSGFAYFAYWFNEYADLH